MTTAIRQHTPEWHDFRREHITARTAAVIAGETGSVLEEWARMRGLIDEPEFDAETRLLMDDGLAMQPFLIDAYARRTGRKVRNVNTTRTSREWPVAACSPDGEVVGEPVGIEAKMSSSQRWAQGEDVPGDVFAQVQWQMYVTGWERVDVVALLWGRVRIVEVPRDPAYLADLLALARQFWGWVESGERPPIDGSETARRVLTAQHPANDGSVLEATPDVLQLVRDIDSAKREVKGTEEYIASMENALRALIGDADGFAGPWGKVTWKRNADSARTNWPAVAAAYRAVAADAGVPMDTLAALESMHTATVEGPRVLRLSLKGTTE